MICVDRNKQEWKWAMGLLGTASVLVSGYNLILIKLAPGGTFFNGSVLNCAGGVVGPIIGLLAGLILIAAAVYQLTRNSPGGNSPPLQKIRS